MQIRKENFGKTANGAAVSLFTLENDNGVKATITNYGGTVLSLFVPDRNGKMADVIVGGGTIEEVQAATSYFGALIGRHANRIEGAAFELNGKTYTLAKNDGNNNLHGGTLAYDKVVWSAEVVERNGVQALKLVHFSKDMDEGFPGNLIACVYYTLSEDNTLAIEYVAMTDADTVCNFTNHAYFNLSGFDSGSILHHQLRLDADKFTPLTKGGVPDGSIVDVAGTPFDFRTLREVGAMIDADDTQIRNGGGYDHNWVLKVNGGVPEVCGEVFDPASGRVMEVLTTKPGIQLYTGNFLDGRYTGKGVSYGKRAALCLETQYFPNAMKHTHFPSPVLKAGEVYNHTTCYRFSVR